jgi:hypothetical protein
MMPMFFSVPGREDVWSRAAMAYIPAPPGEIIVPMPSEQRLTVFLSATGEPGPVAIVPASVTPYQARIAINAAGLRSAVEAAVASADQGVKDAWEYGVEVRRDSPFIVAMQGGLGLTDAQVDALFIAAGKVV